MMIRAADAICWLPVRITQSIQWHDLAWYEIRGSTFDSSLTQSRPKLRLLLLSRFLFIRSAFPQPCYSSSRLHLNYTLASLQSGCKFNFISRSTEGNADAGCVWVRGMSFVNSISQLALQLWLRLIVLETMRFQKDMGHESKGGECRRCHFYNQRHRVENEIASLSKDVQALMSLKSWPKLIFKIL